MSATSFRHFVIERVSDAARHRLLQIEQPADLMPEAVAPDVRAVLDIDQLCVYLNERPHPLHRALKGIPNVQISPNVTGIGRLSFVGKSGARSNNPRPPKPGKIRRKIISYCIRKIVIRSIAADIFEREHDDRIGSGYDNIFAIDQQSRARCEQDCSDGRGYRYTDPVS